MNELDTDRKNLVINRLQEGLRDTEQGREKAVTLAETLSRLEIIQGEHIEFTPDQEFHIKDDIDEFNFQTDEFRRARKIAEVLEDKYHVDVGHGQFAKIATLTAKAQSSVAIVIAGNNLLNASQNLAEDYHEAGHPREVADETYDEFYRSCSIFILECMLFTTPINYKIAWRGTRYVNNRYLYCLHDRVPKLHRLILSEIHYIIRGVVPSTIRSSVDELIEYLTWTTRQSFKILYDYGSIGILEIPGKVQEVLDDFIEFVQETYDVGRSLIEEIDPLSLASSITSDVRDELDIPLSSIEEPPQ